MNKPKLNTASLWDWVKAICTLLLVGVVSYKIYVTPMNLTVDFPTLLSLLLALFSVALAALFYFKATDTSNTFYDNTYNFTKDIAQLLVKIESGFGERLRHLDEGYSSMRDYMQKLPSSDGSAVKQKIEVEKEEIKKVAEERNKMIRELVDRSQLHGSQKQEFLDKLKEKESELEAAQMEIAKMKRRMAIERMKSRRIFESDESDSGLVDYTKERVIPKMDPSQFSRPSRYIMRAFDEIKNELPDGYLEDLEQRGYLDPDGDLSRSGVRFLRGLESELE